MRRIIRLVVVALLAGKLSTMSASSISASESDVQSRRPVTNFRDLQKLAEKVAKQPFVARSALPQELAEMNYDQFREISFRPEKATWWAEGLPFWIETFHRGFVQRDRVFVFAVNEGVQREIEFSPSNFQYRLPISTEALQDAGHAGIKLAGRFPGQSSGEEMLTFLGSSYFRARSSETLYGTSARGLAIDVALNRDEEFPFFRSFWVKRPEVNDEQLTVWALLDSPSVAGAYQFRLSPGTTETRIAVKCSLYFREVPEKVAFAPLTSMWIWGDGLDAPPLDSRPAVHDADGLLIRDANQGWIWRAFARQKYPSVTRIEVDRLRGFGLLQRNRSFYHFNDYNAQYHKRPSVWVRPRGDWAKGVVELLELPGAHEGVDNIAAYWIPAETPRLDQPMNLRYDVCFFAGDRGEESGVARATALNVERQDGLIALDIRFSGVADFDSEESDLRLETTSIRGEVISSSVTATTTGDWIARLLVGPSEDAPVEITATLMDADCPLSERFHYLCPEIEPTFVYPSVYTRQEVPLGTSVE